MEEKKKSNAGLIIFLIILVLGLAGYICYDKFFSKGEPAKVEEKVNNTNVVESDDNYTLEDVKNLLADDSLSKMFYSYKELKETYLQMLPEDALKQKIDIIDALDSQIKVEDGKLYWNKNNSWVEDKKIDSKINYLISDFNPISGYRGVIIGTNDKIYLLDSNDASYDGFSNEEEEQSWAIKWANNVSYEIIDVPGKLQEIQEKFASECEGWGIFQLKIDNKIYYLSYENKIVEAKDFIPSFDRVIGGCGYGAPKGILADGTLYKTVSEDGKKINVGLYVATSTTVYSGYSNVIVIDNAKNLYMFTDEIFEQENTIRLKAIDKVKDYETGIKELDKYSYVNWAKITLSNDNQLYIEY